MKTKIAYCSKWALSVLEDNEGNLFYVVDKTNITLPFKTDEKYILIDVPNLHSLAAKFLLSERRNEILTKQVADSYSAEHLERYFKSKGLAGTTFETVNTVVSHYDDYISEIMGSGKWCTKNQELNKSTEPRLDKDRKSIELFMEYLKENTNI